MDKFAKNVKFLRENKGIKTTETKEKIGFSRTTWAGYENDKSRPPFADMVKIAEFFGVTETELIHADLRSKLTLEKLNELRELNLPVIIPVKVQKESTMQVEESHQHYGKVLMPTEILEIKHLLGTLEAKYYTMIDLMNMQQKGQAKPPAANHPVPNPDNNPDKKPKKNNK